MNPLDRLEPVTVTMCVDDWAVVVTAVAKSDTPPLVKSRINGTIFNAAQRQERTLI